MNNLLSFLTAAILAACPLLLGTLGEGLTEKSGNLNLGVEGMMFYGRRRGTGRPRITMNRLWPSRWHGCRY